MAIEGLLGVVFTVATLTDEAVDVGEVIDAGFSSAMPYLCLPNIVFFFSLPVFFWVSLLSFSSNHQLESPRYEHHPSSDYTGKTSHLCISLVDSLWLTILDSLSLILSRYDSPFPRLYIDCEEAKRTFSNLVVLEGHMERQSYWRY